MIKINIWCLILIFIPAEFFSSRVYSVENEIASINDAISIPAKEVASYKYTLDIGIAQSRQSLSIYDKGTGQSISSGQLSSSPTTIPYLRATLVPNYVDDKMGFYFYAGYSNTGVDRPSPTSTTTFQKVNITELFTGITFFITAGDNIWAHPDKGKQLLIGFGLGPGYINISGTVPGQYLMTGANEKINISGIGLAGDVLIRFTFYGWFCQVGGSGVRIANSTREYQSNVINYAIGKTIVFGK